MTPNHSLPPDRLISRAVSSSTHKHWWKGSRGEWFVVAQLILMAFVFFGPRAVDGRPTWPFPPTPAWRIVGIVFMIGGGTLLAASIFRLRRGLTPLPYPRDGSVLIEAGPYALVRHPMYSGGFVLALGWTLIAHSLLTLGYTIGLFVLLDVKSRREEKWLAAKFPAYTTYQKRVRKLIPYVY